MGWGGVSADVIGDVMGGGGDDVTSLGRGGGWHSRWMARRRGKGGDPPGPSWGSQLRGSPPGEAWTVRRCLKSGGGQRGGGGQQSVPVLL